MKHIKQFPHCDSRILHAPSECKFCDKHPDWQELRNYWGIAFTGHSHEIADDEKHGQMLPCPAEFNRGMTSINGWHGNVPETAETIKLREKYFAEINDMVKNLLNVKNDESESKS